MNVTIAFISGGYICYSSFALVCFTEIKYNKKHIRDVKRKSAKAYFFKSFMNGEDKWTN